MVDNLQVVRLRLLVAVFTLLVVVLAIPLAHAAPSPGIPLLYFAPQGAPFASGRVNRIAFTVQNQGHNTVNGLNLDIKAAQGWSILSGSVYLGTLVTNEVRTFAVQVNVGNPAFPSITFTAKSNDHMQAEFPTSVFVSVGVTTQTIASPGESIYNLINIASQWGNYAVYQVGNLIFPTTQSGITDSTGLQQVLKGYFIQRYLKSHSNLGSQLASIADQFWKLDSDANTIQSNTAQSYRLSVSFGIYTVTVIFPSLYSFVTWTIPLYQWTLRAVQDRSVADLIAWAIQQFAGLNVSPNDIIHLADLLLRIGTGSLGSYAADVRGLGQLISSILSAATPDLSSLNQALSDASRF